FADRNHCFAADPRITSKARPTSLRNSAKSACNNDFFGLITTSKGPASNCACNRTASRKRRFIKFLSTAPPRFLPTVKPTRSPWHAGVKSQHDRSSFSYAYEIRGSWSGDGG